METNYRVNFRVKHKKILFIDDDEHWRSTVKTALSEYGYDVDTAADASEAMRIAGGPEELGLIILDLNLGGESGMALMKYLRHNLPDVRVILYTGMEHDEQDIFTMRQQGAHQYLRKGPIKDLIRAVGRSIQ